MIEWYSKERVFKGQPDDIEISVVGQATILPESAITVKLLICIRRDETVSIEWRTKDVKIWPKYEVENINEYTLQEKYRPWIVKLDKSINNIPFKLFVTKCAAKAKSDVANWVLSLQQL